MHYRYGWPLGWLASRIGVPTLIKVEVTRDEEAGVFVGTSPDVRGLVVEANSIEDLVSEVKALIPELLSGDHDLGAGAIADVHYKDLIAHA